ncbi:MCE family protein [Nocardia sp. NPDC024068]|uniref:MlaD family protein n=1 Tax=Nocardia sp. NPDC024068 TaxID=3157197 RepID=UPI0033DE47CB
MTTAFEADDRNLATWKLLVRGIAFAVVVAAAVAAGIARSQGSFEDTVGVTAIMTDIGDGLPVKSDVKYRGVLVGTVTGIDLTDLGTSRVRIDLEPWHASGIPATVTARVVPSNVFAVPSVQLVDNGPAPALRAGAQLSQDRSLDTVRLQTSLTALSTIAAAAGRSPSDPTVGILETVRAATSGRGEEMLRGAAQLERIVAALNEVAAPDGTGSTLDALAAALTGLRGSAPDLLNAVNRAIVPMQTLAQQRTAFADLLSGGLVTSTRVGTALQNQTGTVTDITARMAPVLDVLARGSPNFVQMTTSQRRLSHRFATEFWDPQTQSATGKIILELTPHKQYSRADCPRYGDLAGPSCTTAPVGPAALPGAGQAVPAAAVDGPTGGPGERDRIATVLGRPPDSLSQLLLGPLLRGNDIHITPAGADGGGGGPR